MLDIQYVIDQEVAFEQVELEGSFIPADITGRLTGELDSSSFDLALVKGNTIVATTETYNIDGKNVEFSFVVPETIFNAGQNLFNIYIIESDEQGKLAFIRLDH